MLTPQQITDLSHTVIGAAATNAAFRNALDIDPSRPGAAVAFAAAINAVQSSSPRITADDIPAIQASVRTMGASQGTSAPVIDHLDVIFFKAS